MRAKLFRKHRKLLFDLADSKMFYLITDGKVNGELYKIGRVLTTPISNDSIRRDYVIAELELQNNLLSKFNINITTDGPKNISDLQKAAVR